MHYVDSSSFRHSVVPPVVDNYPGKNHARKFTAATAMPTPNSTPASTRFEPPSPKANVRPATTMATSERPRAMVLVKAVIRTLTAFSQGEAPCANAGAAKSNVKPRVTRGERSQQLRTYLRRNSFIGEILPVWFELAKWAVEGSPRWLRLEQGKRKRLRRHGCLRRSLDSSPSRHNWSVSSEYSVVPQSRPSPVAGRTRRKANYRCLRLRFVRGSNR